jgi:hypothetical protein
VAWRGVTFKEQLDMAAYAHGNLIGISLCEFASCINAAVTCCSAFCTFERLRVEGMRGLTAERCVRCGFVLIGSDISSKYWSLNFDLNVRVSVDAHGVILAILA